MVSMKSAEDLLASEVKDLYSAEKQLTKTLPKMMAVAKNPELKAKFKAHLAETKHQVTRLETIGGALAVKTSGKVCKGMEGILSESAQALSHDAPPDILDVVIIGAARRIEHYEMAGYRSAIALAEGLGLQEVVRLLNESLAEEIAADDSMKALIPQLLSEFVIDAHRPVKSVAKQMDRKSVRTA